MLATTRRTLTATLAYLLLAAPAVAQQPSVAVHDAWARATAPGQTVGAVYMTLSTPVSDSLMGVSSPDAGAAMLHRTTKANGMTGMADVDSVPIPAGRPVTLAPNGIHVMLMDLKHPLIPGQTVEVDLTFANSPSVHVKAPVQPITASAPPA
jgi:copper(I)-binding protein